MPPEAQRLAVDVGKSRQLGEPAALHGPPRTCTVYDVPRTKILAAGVEATDRWDVGDEGGWYDLTVTVDEAPAFRRRFAGRLENGEPGTSDPAMGTAPA